MRGLARLTYTGATAGTDTFTATIADRDGDERSNRARITWRLSRPPPIPETPLGLAVPAISLAMLIAFVAVPLRRRGTRG
jgi:hypothetical protein